MQLTNSSTRPRDERRFSRSAIAPTVVLMIAVFGVPLVFSLFLSLQGWVVGGSRSFGPFVGFDNYRDLLADKRFLSSAARTLIFTIGVVSAEMIAGLFLALLLNMDLRYISFFRTVLILPMMMTPIVAALCWKLLLDPRSGLVNYLLGIEVIWLGDTHTALLSVAIVNIWQNIPFVAVILLAGLRSLPKDIFEAASVDGVSRLQELCYITLPLLRPQILLAGLLRCIFEFRSFDNVYVMTSGGPADATMVLSVFTYILSFVNFDLSLGAAASWTMLVMICAISGAVVLTLTRQDNHWLWR